MDVCTIVARNFLAYAEVLMASVARHQPAATRTVVVTDAVPGEHLDTDVHVLVLDELRGLDPAELAHLRSIYDVTELATAVKPFVLANLLDRHADADTDHGPGVACYLDPDIELHGPLAGLDEIARGHGIVLTPHVLTPMPDDGLGITERTVLQSGVFNLGFVAVADTADARSFLTWWGSRLRRHCLVDHAGGLFTDQRWVDMVPALHSPAVVRDPGWNVAYWNLHERPLRRKGDGTFEVGDPRGGPPVALTFLHLSGHDPDDATLLSRHQGERPRVLLSEHADLAAAAGAWRARIAAAGHAERRRVPYRHRRSDDGLELTVEVRRFHRHELLAAEGAGEPRPPAPLDPAGSAAFVARANEADHSPFGGGLPRVLAWLRSVRPDLLAAFPAVPGPDVERMLEWAAADPDLRLRLPDVLRPSPPAPRRGRPPWPASRRSVPTPGFNVVGYLESELGVGESGRLLVAAVEAAGLPVATRVERSTSSRQGHAFAARGRGVVHDTTVLAVNADRTPPALASLSDAERAGRRHVGLWFWEVDVLPDAMAASVELVDEVWVASRYVGAVVAPHAERAGVPVHRFPLPVLWPTAPTEATRADVGLDERFTFLFAFDFFSVVERKNPLGLVAAYRRAFGPDDGARLVLKSVNGERRIRDLEHLRLAVADRPDIEVRDGYLSAPAVRALVERSDAYVSLHRSEGFGLTVAHAMAAGRPVVCTAHGGVLDFTTPDVVAHVPAALVAVGPGNDPYPAHARWGDPDLDVAAARMRRLFDDPHHAVALGAAGRDHVVRHHGLAPAVDFLRARFDEQLVAVPA